MMCAPTDRSGAEPGGAPMQEILTESLIDLTSRLRRRDVSAR